MLARFLSLGVLAGMLAALSAAAAEPGLVVKDGWIRSIVPSRPAAGYFALSNETDRDRTLVGASSPACGTLMLHQSLHESGQDRMEMVEKVPVPAHGTVNFTPGGYHLMCMSPSKEMASGHSVPVTLRFADHGTITANFAVRTAVGR
jgi:periplasmic copper chaperone A